MPSKKLLVVIQSGRINLYVNVITHCVEHEEIGEIFFVCRESLPEEKGKSKRFVLQIYSRLNELITEHKAYKYALQHMPSERDLKDHILEIDFVNPDKSIKNLKKKIKDFRGVVVDISGASRQLAGNIMISFMSHRIDHVSHFVLDDKVYTDEWTKSGKESLYHNLINDDGVPLYTYSDFSKSRSISTSMKKLRAEGGMIRALLILSILLTISIIIAIATQKVGAAQIAAITALITVIVSLLESITGFSKVLGKIRGENQVT